METGEYPKRFFVEIAYDGTHYFGWQRQPDVLTVQQVIEETLSKLYAQEITIVGCGRTDTGVNAKQYFFHFDAPKERQNLAFILQKMFPSKIGVLGVHEVEPTAHARFDATERTYWYFLDENFDTFRRNQTWWYPLSTLNFDEIYKATKLFTQYKNYTALCRFNPELNNHDSYVTQAEWCYFKPEKRVIFKVKSNRYLRNQIRRMVGCLIDIGRGTLNVNELEQALKHGTEMKYNRAAPPQGLFLWQIKYPYIIPNKL